MKAIISSKHLSEVLKYFKDVNFQIDEIGCYPSNHLKFINIEENKKIIFEVHFNLDKSEPKTIDVSEVRFDWLYRHCKNISEQPLTLNIKKGQIKITHTF